MTGFAVVTALASPVQSTPLFDQIVVDDILLADNLGGVERSWELAFPLGDADSDGFGNFFAFGGSSSLEARYLLASGLREGRTREFSSFPGIITPPLWNWPSVALTRSPAEMNLITYDSNPLNPMPIALGVPSWQFYGPFQGSPRQPYGMMRATDSTGDGWEDLFVQTFDPATTQFETSLLDGRTLATVWSNTEANASVPRVTEYAGLGPWPDLDGDGFSDYVSCWPLWFPPSTPGHRLVAYSGADGQVIWQRSGLGGTLGHTVGRDLNGDGVADVVFVGPAGELEALDGAGGSSLWVTPKSAVQSMVAPGLAGHWFLRPISISARIGDPQSVDVLVPIETHTVLPTIISQEAALFDGTTGQFIQEMHWPETLEPWTSETFLDGRQIAASHFLLGDIDRDGIVEIARRVDAPLSDDPSTPSFPTHLVILSRQTLEVAETVSVGTPLPVEIGIPSAAGLSYRILVSDQFDRDGGVVIDDWKTHLVRTPIFSASLQDPGFAGVLDSAGRATHLLQIPSSPSLVGRTLHMRAVVETSPGSAEVHTVSSLGSVELIP